MVTSVVSISLSYILFAVSAFVIVIIGTFLCYHFNIEIANIDIISFPVTGILQLIFANILFSFDRFKKGMPHLQEGKIEDSGILVCFFLLISMSLFNANPSNDVRFLAYLSVIIISGILLILWWIKRLTQCYLERLKAQEIEKLILQIQQLREKNQELKNNNDELSKIIHKDNKLIPAMEFCVCELLQSSHFSNIELKEKASALLRHLENISEERYGIIQSYVHMHRRLQQTGVVSIDSMIKYMEQKAYNIEINLDLSITGNIKYMVEAIIGEHDLSTLIADLLENAQNAMLDSHPKYILLCIGIEGDYYSLNVFDSGIQFNVDVLSRLGRLPSTSHAETGGNGIGMMTCFEIIKKYSASFILDEVSASAPYCKKISICFDGLSQFRVKSNRPELLVLQSIRPDIILL